MPEYSFLNLSPSEFEDLTRDLLQKHLNLTLESFTSGRDNGIDIYKWSSSLLRIFILREFNTILRLYNFSNSFISVFIKVVY